MEVLVKLYGPFRRFSPEAGHVFNLTLPEQSTMGHLLQTLNITGEFVPVVLVNGRRSEKNLPMNHGDTAVVMAPMDGG